MQLGVVGRLMRGVVGQLLVQAQQLVVVQQQPLHHQGVSCAAGCTCYVSMTHHPDDPTYAMVFLIFLPWMTVQRPP